MNLSGEDLLDSRIGHQSSKISLSLISTHSLLIKSPKIGLGLLIFHVKIAQCNSVHIIRKHILPMQRHTPLLLLLIPLVRVDLSQHLNKPLFKRGLVLDQRVTLDSLVTHFEILKNSL